LGSGDGSLRPADSPAAFSAAASYFRDGSFLLDSSRPNWLALDTAFGGAPISPPRALPSFADLKAAEDEAFFRRAGRTPPLFGAPAANGLGAPRLPIAGPVATPFYKLPDPLPPWSEAMAPRPGAIGDVMDAAFKLPAMQDLRSRLSDQGAWRLHEMERYWNNRALIEQIGLVTLTAPLAAGVVGAVLGADEARHKAFSLLRGVALPVPFVPGLKFKINDFGKADPFLLGAPRAEPNRPSGFEMMFMLDLTKIKPGGFNWF
jgi:hypothetical protein